MKNKIIVCGLNGTGKSTLGKKLAQELGWKFLDIEEYYFPKTSGDYKYSASRTKEQVKELLLEDMEKYDNLVLASVHGNYGERVAAMFTGAVWINTPKEIRMERVRNRSYQKFGDRILPGGDLHDKEEYFFNMVSKREESYVTEWLDSMNIPVIQVDGTEPIEKSIKIIELHFKKDSFSL